MPPARRRDAGRAVQLANRVISGRALSDIELVGEGAEDVRASASRSPDRVECAPDGGTSTSTRDSDTQVQRQRQHSGRIVPRVRGARPDTRRMTASTCSASDRLGDEQREVELRRRRRRQRAVAGDDAAARSSTAGARTPREARRRPTRARRATTRLRRPATPRPAHRASADERSRSIHPSTTNVPEQIRGVGARPARPATPDMPSPRCSRPSAFASHSP